MRLLPRPLLTLFLALLWLLLNNSLALGQVLLGLLLGWGIPLLTAPFLLSVPPVRRPLTLCRFLLRVLYDIVVANLHVARLVLGPTKRLRPAFVEVPMVIEDEFVLTVLTSVVSLAPGTVSAGVTADHRRLLLHGLDIADTEVFIAQLKRRYEAPLLEIFQCSPT